MYDTPLVYAVKHKNNATRMASRSGGVFTALSDHVLKEGGVIYGCALNKNLLAVHIRASTAEERDRMRGSKYIQSEMGNAFESAKRDLEQGLYVLFSGTSCQIAGFRRFLGKEYDNLICVDIVCHNVPSPLIWKEHVHKYEKENNASCIDADFRNKKEFGWGAHIETLTLQKGEEQFPVHSVEFVKLFYNTLISRPCCTKCPYASVLHPADITIADYWNIEKAAPGFRDQRGVSLVLINNEKGEALFNNVLQELTWVKTALEDSLQPPLLHPTRASKSRTAFWKRYRKRGYADAANKYAKDTFGQICSNWARKAKNRCKRLFNHFIGK